ncbi:hypothetical protein RRG08_023241 [Elysia crispata]|uniref:G-protein coupled receptors family 1 profile domain-containing protein n=1 Tax=Elysia crispata TaxID=231223 RepID=A0AAE0ZQT9_9GAST|nr:hypothetical protein RRG08_023241 [Elysia crispata]
MIGLFYNGVLLQQVGCAVMSPGSSNSQKAPAYRKCPAEFFPCVSGHVTCVNRTLLCDHKPDCEDGSDEEALCDTYQYLIFDNLFKKRIDADRENDSAACSLGRIPEDCDCREETKIYCENRGIQRVPSPLPLEVTFLDISGNNLSSLPRRALGHLPYLETLKIDSSHVKMIESGALYDCPDLSDVILSNNGFSSFSADIFLKDNSVHTLNLLGNSLAALKKGSLTSMRALKDLVVKSNKINSIEPGVFRDTPNLESLDLTDNLISEIQPHFFEDLHNLKKLFIMKNRITMIQPHSFAALTSLAALSLASNRLRSLHNTYFTGLGNLTVLYITHNYIETIEKETFLPTKSINSLDLWDNDLTTITNGTFQYMPDLRFIYFDKFYFCAYAKQASVCKPEGDGISSKQNLLGSPLLRVSVWLVAMLACFGNLLVLLGRCLLLREDNPIHSFFIKNLSLADLLMGLYLLVIGVHDAKFRGDYLAHDQAWRNSWGCDASGVLSTLSTEMSVLTLCIITLDRYISIMYPLSFRRRGLKLARLIMAFTWAVCLALAAFPVMGLLYFGRSFYRDNAVCIPLHLHNPRARGWEYSSFLFLGLNLGSFAFIAYAYVAMFYSIHMSALPLRTSRDSKERCLAKRFFFIVITNFLCWIPIIIIKIVALAGVSISNDLYAWVIVFVLPVNSALNPLLYTLTTKLFKKQLLTKFTSVVFRPSGRDRPGSTQTSSSSLQANTMAARQVTNIEMDILKRYDPVGSCGTQLRATTQPLNGCDRQEARPRRISCDPLSRKDLMDNRHSQRQFHVFRSSVAAQDQASQQLLD